ncbi:MAG: FtsX-like permease family protein, partial [Candidatus Margulisbacteria bacterium]|nr:FtsX-like permease family protein [Candidatus Margulisiibacteriota bacterium]
SFLTGLSIGVAVMIVIVLWTFISGVLNDMFNNYVTASVGHVRVMNSEYLRRETMLPLSSSVYNYGPIIKSLENNKEVRLATGRIKFGVLMDVKGRNKPIIGVGIDPAREEAVLALSKKMVDGRVIVAGTRETNIGVGMAKELGLKTGDTLTIITQTAGGSLSGMNLKVAGIFNLGVGAIDKRTFYLPLDQAQYLLDMDNRVTEIFVLLNRPAEAVKFSTEIKKDMPAGLTAVPWQENGLLYFMMTAARGIYAVIYAFILVLASFTILNTMFMAVLERTKEIGMMKALGMREGAVGRLIVLESMILGFLASFAGAAFGAIFSYYISVVGLDYTAVFEKMGTVEIPLPNVYHGLFSWTTILTGFILGVVLAVLAAISPARRAAKLEAAEAMRE